MDNPIKTEEIHQNPSEEIKSIEQMIEMKDDTLSIGTGGQKSKNPFSSSKIIAFGMMDVALLTANANQLRFLITYNTKSPTYYISLSLVIVSLVLQISVGIVLILKRSMRNTGGRNKYFDNSMNNLITIGIFFITVINVCIASFTVTTN